MPLTRCMSLGLWLSIGDVCAASGRVPAHSRWSVNTSHHDYGSSLSCSDRGEKSYHMVSASGQTFGVLLTAYSPLPLELSASKPCHLSLQMASEKSPSSWLLQLLTPRLGPRPLLPEILPSCLRRLPEDSPSSNNFLRTSSFYPPVG